MFNGKDITEVNVFQYRKLLSLVAQEPTLFSGTLRGNILLGVNPDEITEEQLHQCCRDANIHDFIVSLPDGYNTNIGSKGVNLSGGQKQRVSIARALIRDPRVLLLDEATSSLDSESEKLVQAAFERVAKGRTTIAVAHRLATIQKADIIYVLGEGKVLEKGSHAELLKLKGVYWNMVSSRSSRRNLSRHGIPWLTYPNSVATKRSTDKAKHLFPRVRPVRNRGTAFPLLWTRRSAYRRKQPAPPATVGSKMAKHPFITMPTDTYSFARRRLTQRDALLCSSCIITIINRRSSYKRAHLLHVISTLDPSISFRAVSEPIAPARTVSEGKWAANRAG